MQLKQWLALWFMPGLSTAKLARLMAAGCNAQALLQAQTWPFKLSDEQTAYLKAPDWTAVDQTLVWAEKPEHSLLGYHDPNYPSLLKQIHSAPAFLFVVGHPALLNKTQLAIVGSRRPSRLGLKQASTIAVDLSKAGLLITSGMALGIDGASHTGALNCNKPTIAVLGCGVDHVYPRRHQPLYQEIKQQGAIVSEFALGTQPMAKNFPQRNRIISGMSIATLVVEAAQRSGSLITAQYALEQGREVFAMPGPVNSPVSQGCHDLIRQGALLVTHANDVLAALPDWVELGNVQSQSNVPVDNAHPLLAFIDYSPSQVDDIIALSGLPSSEVLTKLQELVLAGLVEHSPSGYTRC